MVDVVRTEPFGGIESEGRERLGNYTCKLKEGSMAMALYGTEEIIERHRHRLELNNEYRESLEKAGLKMTGIHEELNLVEVVELEGNDFFLGCTFNPEFRHRPNRIHPLFKGFIKAAAKNRSENN